jgi:hypothetical protein
LGIGFRQVHLPKPKVSDCFDPVFGQDGRVSSAHSKTESFLLSGLSLGQPQLWNQNRFPLALKCLESSAAEFPHLPLSSLPVDISGLLSGEKLVHVTVPDLPHLREAVRAYEDFLARLCTERRFLKLAEAFAAAPDPLKPAAAGLFVGQLLGRMNPAATFDVPMGFLRRLIGRPVEEVQAESRFELLGSGFVSTLVAALTNIAASGRKQKELVTESDVFFLENVASLKMLSARINLDHLTQASRTLENAMPVRIKSNLRETGDANTKLEDESSFPVGGFSSISTVGTLENLVTSELIYMDESDSTQAKSVDLFDLRFVEGELLYYARDESVSLRKKKALLFVFDSSLASARILDRGQPHQRLTWMLGLCAAVCRKLLMAFTADALTIEFVFPAQNTPLAEERAVLELLLREYKERGQIQFVDALCDDQYIADAKRRMTQRLQTISFANAPVHFSADVYIGAQQDQLIVSGRTLAESFRYHEAALRCLESLLENKRVAV